MENLLSLVLRAFEKRRHLHQIDYLNHAQHAKIRTTTKEEACDDLQKKKSKKKKRYKTRRETSIQHKGWTYIMTLSQSVQIVALSETGSWCETRRSEGTCDGLFAEPIA